MGTPRNLGHFTAVSLFMFLLLISSIVSVDFAFAQSQTTEGQFPQSIITKMINKWYFICSKENTQGNRMQDESIDPLSFLA